MGDFSEDLVSFIEGDGFQQFKERMADQFRQDAPSKSGKSKAAIMASQEGVVLPSALWRVDKGRTVTDPSGVKLPTASSGAGFIDEVLGNDLTIWAEIITTWCDSRSDVSDITSG
tara:strand:+ start:9896 stop:10240 length:345 start_codon:yes stop_codon:yes gene_type:complete